MIAKIDGCLQHCSRIYWNPCYLEWNNLAAVFRHQISQITLLPVGILVPSPRSLWKSSGPRVWLIISTLLLKTKQNVRAFERVFSRGLLASICHAGCDYLKGILFTWFFSHSIPYLFLCSFLWGLFVQGRRIKPYIRPLGFENNLSWGTLQFCISLPFS